MALAACGPGGGAPATTLAAPDDIITSTEPLTAAELFEAFTPEDVEAYGGEECARQMATLWAAGFRYLEQTGDEPGSVDDLMPYAEGPITLWANDGDELVPADGSPCAVPD